MTRRPALRLLTFGGVIAVSSVLGYLLQVHGPLRLLELRSYDWRIALTGSRITDTAPVTLLVIDEPSLSRIPDPLMLWHGHFADALDACVMGGASTVVFDILFANVDTVVPEASRRLNAALLNAGSAGLPVVLSYRIRSDGEERPPVSLQVAAEGAGHTFGFANLTSDSDDFIRRQELHARGSDGAPAPSLALAAAEAYAGRRDRTLKAAGDGPFWIRFRHRDAFPRVSFADVVEAQRRGDQQFLESHFKDRIVLIASASGRGGDDMHSTPHYYWSESDVDGRRVPGVLIHANTIATLLAGDSISEWDNVWQWLQIVAAAALLTIASVRLSLRGGVIVFGVLTLAGLGFVVWMFGRGVWVWTVAPAVSGMLALGLAQAGNYYFEGRERRRLRNLFGRYVSDDVIHHLLNMPEGVVLSGETRRIAVLFADIRGFTTRSETAGPEEIVDLLNEYFTRVVEVIQLHGGTVNSLMGDGIMAIFGAPVADRDAARHAVNAACAMMRSVEELNVSLVARGMAPIAIGIGINAGDAVVGNMGSPKMMEYTAIGDVVNTASRIEGKTKDVHADILISEAAREWAGPGVVTEPKGELLVKGRLAAVPVHSVAWR